MENKHEFDFCDEQSQTAEAPTFQIVYDDKASTAMPYASQTTEIHSDRTKQIKVLLLGCSHVGKSTMFKQICRIYGDGFQLQDIQQAKQNVYDCIINQMKQILEFLQLRKQEADYDGSLDSMSDSARTASRYVGDNRLPRGGVTISPDLCDKLKTLWAESSVKRAYQLARSSNIGVAYSAAYFFDSLDRIADPNYVPTTEDILKVRIATTGLRTCRVNVGDTQMTFVDTGGERNERYKWIYLFSGVHCLILPVALDHFDKNLFEDDDVNAMHEQLMLFHSLMDQHAAPYRFFKNCPIELVFTFKDLFEDQIVNQQKSLSMCFEDYNYDKHAATESSSLIRPLVERVVESYLATIHRHIDDMNVPPLVIYLCAVYYGDETQFAIDFIINKFKSMIPEERMDSVRIHTICTFNKKEVKSVVDEIPQFARQESHQWWMRSAPGLAESRVREIVAREIVAATKKGKKQIKWLFSIFSSFMVFLGMILILIPIDMVSYIEVAISSVTIILFGILIVKEQYQRGHVFVQNEMIEMELPQIGLFIIILAVIWPFNVVLAQRSLDTETRLEWAWMIYILCPIGLVLLYFVMTFRTLFWIEHSMWTLCWFGIMMILTGICTDIDGITSTAMWIVGLCSIVLGLIVPLAVNRCVK